MSNSNIEVKWVSVNQVKPHPRNNNKHTDDQIARLAKLLRYQGQRTPLVVSNRSGFLVKGHATLAAVRLNKVDTIAVTYQDFEDDAQEYAYMTSDNAIAAWSEIDLSQIITDVQEFLDFDVDLLGIKNYGADENVNEEIDPDDGTQISVNVSFTTEESAEHFYQEMQARGLECKLIV